MSMLTLELVSKKRKPIKRNAFLGIIIGILLLTLIGLTSHWIANTIQIVLMVLVACIFVICLYIINYSVKFKNAIGRITFSEDNIEIEFLQKTEIIQMENIDNVRFKLAGYEGLNNSTILDLTIWSFSFFSYHSGMNNFVYIYTNTGLRTFEFYIPNKKDWLNINKIARLYHDR
jgi:hypothetical protein